MHLAAYSTKKQSVLNSLEQEADGLAATPFNIGHVAIGTALSYLDFRYADEDWRTPHPRIAHWHRDFCARPSVQATEPIDDS
jgi:glutathione S-transferase